MTLTAEQSFRYEAVADDLRNRIAGGQFAPGARLPNERRLAEHYKVNHLTLRRALGLLSEQGLVDRQARRGTFVSKQLDEADRTRSVLYLGDLRKHDFAACYAAFGEVAGAAGVAVTGYPAEATNGARARLRELIAAASEIVCTAESVAGLGDWLAACPRVVVVDPHAEFSESGPAWEWPTVGVDYRRAIRLATDHLLTLGHRRLALLEAFDAQRSGVLTGEPGKWRNSVQAFEACLRRAGAVGVSIGHLHDRDDSTEAAIEAAAERLGGPPTGFVCSGDFRAAPLLRVLARRGIEVPAAVSVIGVGNTPWCDMLNPPLTSIDLGMPELARTALLMLREDQSKKTHLTVQPQLVLRSSTAEVPL